MAAPYARSIDANLDDAMVDGQGSLPRVVDGFGQDTRVLIAETICCWQATQFATG